METEIGFIPASRVKPDRRQDICGECRAKGFNLCDRDEVCQIRLAEALGLSREDVELTLREAERKGVVKVRTVRVSRDRPRKFIKITEMGEILFAAHERE
ncbi:MAG: hypothetical protein GXN98_04340 [Euryarchaeota archaeon]|nr:hypothetical protein [Euryarchaeota archaeon]